MYRISEAAAAFLYPRHLIPLQEALLGLQGDHVTAAVSFADVLEHEGHLFLLYPHKKKKTAKKFTVPVSHIWPG